MQMSSGASTTSESGGLRCTPPFLDAYLHGCGDCLHTELFNAIPLYFDAGMVLVARNGLIRDMELGVWRRRWTH